MTAVLEAPIAVPAAELAHVTVKAVDLYNLLKTAGTFASSDVKIPVLNNVLLERRGNYLLAIATDRFRLAVTRIPVATLLETTTVDAIGDFTALISIEQIKATLPMFKVSARDANWLEVRLTLKDVDASERSQFANRSVSWVRTDRAISGTFTDRSADYDFPRWRQLIPADRGPIDRDVTGDASRFGVDVGLFKDFSAAVWHKSQSQIVVEPAAPTKPIVVRVGTHFLGLIMPARFGEDSPANSADTRASWTDTLS